jgi:hypothetical protein
MKNAVFWDVVPCRFIKNRRFGGTCRLHLHGRRNNASGVKVLGGCQQTLQFEEYFFYHEDKGDTFL